MNLISVGIGAGAFVLGYFFYEFNLRKNPSLWTIISAVKKKRILAMLETDKAVFPEHIVKVYKSIGITPKKDLIIFTRGSPKMLYGTPIQVVHADIYKSITVPQELRKLVKRLENKGWKAEDIGQFFEEVEKTPADVLEKVYKEIKATGKKTVIDEEGNVVERDASEIEKQKYDVFIGMSSVVKDFIYTGINRTTIKSMLREMVYQRELEKIGRWNILYVAIAVLLILIGLGFFLPKVLPYLSQAVPKPPAPPARISP